MNYVVFSVRMLHLCLYIQVECCSTSTETIRTIRDVGAAHDGHLDFHTAPEFCAYTLHRGLHFIVSSEGLFVESAQNWTQGENIWPGVKPSM